MRRHWQARTPRERRLLAAAAAVLAGLLLWAGAWEPLERKRDTLRREVTENAEALAWLLPTAARHEARVPAAGDNASLLSRVDAAAGTHGVQAQLATLEPDGKHLIRMQFNEVRFDAFARWLDTLARQGVAVEELSLQRSTAPGRVHARLTLRDTRA